MISRETGNYDLRNKSGDSDPVLDSPCPWNIYLYINLYPIINYITVDSDHVLDNICNWNLYLYLYLYYTS